MNSIGDVWTFTRESGLKADTILYNSLIDAYVNCGEIERAYDTFCQMTKPKNSVYLEKQDEEATPNVRTCNITLKGFARVGEESRAMQVTQEMRKKICDNVSTNTLVSFLVSAGNFELAESVLTNYTTTIPDVSHHRPTDHHKQRTQHYKGTKRLSAFVSLSMANAMYSVRTKDTLALCCKGRRNQSNSSTIEVGYCE